MSCLVDHRGNISEYQCNQYITKITGIIFSDYRLICGFMDKCKDDINNLHCGSINVGHKVRTKRPPSCRAAGLDLLKGDLLEELVHVS